ncbi:MAG: non-canonical purine NTP pyrophosphatase, RdgB/HAM1 family [Flammeovirgaceae bacterium]|nr:non-canonical purine NTP pyrophosphatase, RdgB/HAM1 family [Flammeovirgaceae bacterium]MBR06301.1 non-canonical purine NTP pyrophosphatase, RdgB/HAM1 family [Rickettsiales bacterium]HCX24841.1 non-canonical purine NTP pyrophosphatase, RdgB/HAM1 family [Cytophagales bacterium]|tara:strand:- start:420 stop:998 length:579 start_codon:yes stop_codon:yes gene_type:complete
MILYFASHNQNKVKEIAKLLPQGMELRSLDDLNLHEDIPETASTIEGNSLMKTEYVYKKHRVACFGDDTGLEVDALNGEPGVYSARYAGPQKSSEDNMSLLLSKLEGVQNRKARFKTVITFFDENGEISQFTGIATGGITNTKSGSEGFGYDPIFQPDGYPVTFAEMSAEDKNKISHRGKAFEQLVNFLKNK